MAQAHIASGGKLSDLPPPPPSSNPDYVQCPSCGRRFNEAAAQRHIPKCATYEFNKPKPGAAKKRWLLLLKSFIYVAFSYFLAYREYNIIYF